MGLSEIQAIVIASGINRLNGIERRTGKDAADSAKRIGNQFYDGFTDCSSVVGVSDSISEYAVPCIAEDDPARYRSPQQHRSSRHLPPDHPSHHHARTVSLPHINAELPPHYQLSERAHQHQRHQSMPRHFHGLYTHHEVSKEALHIRR
jgi:hypothetical protein